MRYRKPGFPGGHRQSEAAMRVLARSVFTTVAIAALAVTALLPFSIPGNAERAVPESAEALKLSFAPVVKRAAPAVVNVYVRHRVTQMVSPFFDDPFFGRLFGERFGIPRERIQNSLGSGVLVSGDGVVVTNDHVIQGSGEAEITVALNDGREFPAKIVLKDEQSDLAVLRLNADGVQFPSIVFSDSDSLEVGDLVLDREKQRVLLKGRPLSLTKLEFNILAHLMGDPGRVFTRDELLDGAWQGEAFVTDRTVDVHMRSIRQKLGRSRDLVETVRGSGYRFAEPPEPARR